MQTQSHFLLRVIKPTNVTSFNLNPQLFPLEMATQRALETQATHYLHSVTQRLQNAERRFVTRVLIDANPASTILEEAQNQAVDLIALATHARSGWARFTLGSVADKGLRGSLIPVLIVRSKDGDA